jgi:hypothetical protein
MPDVAVHGHPIAGHACRDSLIGDRRRSSVVGSSRILAVGAENLGRGAIRSNAASKRISPIVRL